MGSKRAQLGLALALVSSLHTPLSAQGCSQCRDNVSQTNPAVQASYREAILILLGATATISAAAVFVIRKMR